MFSQVIRRFEEARVRFWGVSDTTRDVLKTVVQAFSAAIVAVLFMQSIHAVFSLLYSTRLQENPKWFLPLSLIWVLFTSFGAAWLMKTVPSASGSGIPQAKLAYWKELGFIPFKSVWIKFFAGVLNVGGGASLGREGPTVFLGSGIATGIDGLLGANKRQRRASNAVGAAAGLAAAFNTPLAAITFCIEELIGDLNTRYLGRVVLASLIGALVVYATVGRQPSFQLPLVEAGRWELFIFIPIVAVFASGLGLIFQRSALALRLKVKRNQAFPVWFAPVIGGFVTWCIGSAVYLWTGKIGIFGLGYHDLSEMLISGSVLWIACVLVIGKLLATIVSYSFGGCGGIFSPTLFIGGFAGAVFAGVVSYWFPLTSSEKVILATIGMSACMGTVIRAPLTSTLIVFEMTHQFEIVPGLILSAAISILMAKRYGEKHNFYDALLVQDGNEIHKIIRPKDLQFWQNRPVTEIMNSKPICIEKFDVQSVQMILRNHPYRVFVKTNLGFPEGLILREELVSYLNTQGLPTIQQPVLAFEMHTIREVSELFIHSPQGFIAIVDQSGVLTGVLTLHDLLRAQIAASE